MNHDHLNNIPKNLLMKLGISVKDIYGFEPLQGRNQSSILNLADGTQLVIKNFIGRDNKGRLERSIDFDRWYMVVKPQFLTARVIAVDSSSKAIAYTFIRDLQNLAFLARDCKLQSSLHTDLGTVVGKFHDSPLELVPATSSSFEMPPRLVDAIPIDFIETITNGQMELLQILQQDREIADSLEDLVSRDFEPTAVHGDLRFDQFGISSSDLYLMDFEEFRLGDPARDLGSLIGEAFYYWMRNLGDFEHADNVPENEERLIAHGISLIENAAFDITKIQKSYFAIRRNSDNLEFRSRVMKYVGWHLYDRAFAAGFLYGKLNTLDRAIAGLGRKLLLADSDMLEAVGLGE